MDEKDRTKFAQLMLMLAENCSSEVSTQSMKFRFAALQNYTIDQIETATYDIARTRKYTKMPTVADFVSAIDGEAGDIAEIEAGRVLDAIRSKGQYADIAFADKTTNAVIAQGFGGWTKLCRELLESQESYFRRDFAKIYQAFKKRGVVQDKPSQAKIEGGYGPVGGLGVDVGINLLGDV